jgi:alpha-tubulin suppressor-like RCC1 family protein
MGNGTTMTSKVPVMTLTGVAHIAIGDNQGCAQKDDGSIVCWGANYVAQLGDGTYAQRTTPVAVTVPGATALAGGGDHTCALAGDAVTCWGNDVWGQLGDGIVDYTSIRGVGLPCP